MFCPQRTRPDKRVTEGTVKAKPTEGKTALEEFTRTMKALFRVPKSAVQEEGPKRIQPKKPPKPRD